MAQTQRNTADDAPMPQPITIRPVGPSHALLREAKDVMDRHLIDGLAREILTTREALRDGIPHVFTVDDHAVEARYAARLALALLEPDRTLQATMRAREAISAYLWRRDYATLPSFEQRQVNRAAEEATQAYIWTLVGIVSELLPGSSRRTELTGDGVR